LPIAYRTVEPQTRSD